MKGRCKESYHDSHVYFQRGIKICEQWDEFRPFALWAINNGYNNKLTLDRLDNEKGYSPDNCRWATWKEQQNNKRNNAYITYLGKTQTLNVYGINNEFYFIDVPGYGYARVSKSIKATFGKMIEEYVINRENLKLVFLLVDYRHKPTEDDVLMYNFLKYYNKKVVVIATKSDKIKNSERAKCKKVILDTLQLHEGDKLIITSSEKREGLGLVLQTLDDELAKAEQ